MTLLISSERGEGITKITIKIMDKKLEEVLRQLEHQNYHANSAVIAERIRKYLESDGKVCIRHSSEAAAVIECNDCQIDFIK